MNGGLHWNKAVIWAQIQPLCLRSFALNERRTYFSGSDHLTGKILGGVSVPRLPDGAEPLRIVLSLLGLRLGKGAGADALVLQESNLQQRQERANQAVRVLLPGTSSVYLTFS